LTFLSKTLFFLLLGLSICAQELKIVTEEYPPFNYEEDGNIKGFSTEIVEEILRRMDKKIDIELLPWSRAYNLTLTKEGYALFSVVKSQDREPYFKWVGPIIESSRSVFWGLEGKEYGIKKLEDAKRYKIGTYKNDADEQYLIAQGFQNLDSVVSNEQNLKKLLSGRIDLWATGDTVGYSMLEKIGAKTKIKPVFTIREEQMYIAFSKSTPQDTINKWQKILDDMKKDGFYDNLAEKYFK